MMQFLRVAMRRASLSKHGSQKKKKKRRNNTYFSFGHLKSRELSYAICTMLRVKLLKSSSQETKRIKLASKYLVELEISLTGNKMTKIGYLTKVIDAEDK